MNTKVKTPILIIEDNPGDVKLTQILIQQASSSYLVYVAQSFFEAGEVIKNHPIELALLDLSLPDAQGFKTVTRFLEEFPSTPVIVITGNNNEIIGNQAVRAGAQDFLVKGQFDSVLLGRSIRYALQRSKTQAKLEETARNLLISKRRSALAQEMAQFGNWEMDLVTNEMTWSDEVFRIFGLQPQSLSPSLSSYVNYVHVEDKANIERFFDSFSREWKHQVIQHRIIVNGQHIKTLELNGQVIFDEHTNKTIVVGCVLDLSQRGLDAINISPAAPAPAPKPANHQNNVIELGCLIRTLLASIINYLYILQPKDKNQEEYLQGLDSSVNDLWGRVNDLLNSMVHHTGNLLPEERTFTLRDILSNNTQWMAIFSGMPLIELHTEIDEAIPSNLSGDINKIQLILSNLFEFIYRHSGTNQVFLKALAGPQKEQQFELRFEINCKKPKPFNSSIIDLINTSDYKALQSSDLDLSTALRLCQVLGGTLKIGKQKTGGCFLITIPVKVANEKAGSLRKPNTPLRILMVEDHRLNQFTTKKILQDWSENVYVDIAENGMEGVQRFRETVYDLILMDLKMPVMDGLEAAREIRKESDIPIIALTAKASVPEKKLAFDIGFNEYLPKPIKPEDLQKKIIQVISDFPD